MSSSLREFSFRWLLKFFSHLDLNGRKDPEKDAVHELKDEETGQTSRCRVYMKNKRGKAPVFLVL